jgi:hypothetical protein
MHRLAVSAVRVGAEGFVWLLNSSARVSDVTASKDETRGVAERELRALERGCEAVAAAWAVVVEVVERAMTTSASSLSSSS